MNRLIKNTLKNKFLEILTWVGEFRPGNKTIYTVFDEESDFQVKNMQFLCPDGKNKEKRNVKNLCFNLLFFFSCLFFNMFIGL